jgi:hypothetical protein
MSWLFDNSVANKSKERLEHQLFPVEYAEYHSALAAQLFVVTQTARNVVGVRHFGGLYDWMKQLAQQYKPKPSSVQLEALYSLISKQKKKVVHQYPAFLCCVVTDGSEQVIWAVSICSALMLDLMNYQRSYASQAFPHLRKLFSGEYPEQKLLLIKMIERYRQDCTKNPQLVDVSSFYRTLLAVGKEFCRTETDEENLKALNGIINLIKSSTELQGLKQRKQDISEQILEHNSENLIHHTVKMGDERIKVTTRLFKSPSPADEETNRDEIYESNVKHLEPELVGPEELKKAYRTAALQSIGMTERIRRDRRCLPCSFNGSTHAEIGKLLTILLADLNGQETRTVAWIVLVALLTGRGLDQVLKILAGKTSDTRFISTFTGKVRLQHQHTVPAQTQPEINQHFISAVSLHITLALPDILTAPLPVITAETELKISEYVSRISKTSLPRLNINQIGKELERSMVQNQTDRLLIAFITGAELRERAALSYTRATHDMLQQSYQRQLTQWFSLVPHDIVFSEYTSGDAYGSPLRIPDPKLTAYFHFLQTELTLLRHFSRADPAEFHNTFVCYCYLVWSLCTGLRPVDRPFGFNTQINPITGAVWIEDKDIRNGSSSRIIYFTYIALQQYQMYISHLQELSRHFASLKPQWSQRCDAAIKGEAPLLFVMDKYNRVNDAEQKKIKPYLKKVWPLQANWARHHLRSILTEQAFLGAAIDAWMGHQEVGEEFEGTYSGAGYADLKPIRDWLSEYMQSLQIQVIPGWQKQ